MAMRRNQKRKTRARRLTAAEAALAAHLDPAHPLHHHTSPHPGTKTIQLTLEMSQFLSQDATHTCDAVSFYPGALKGCYSYATGKSGNTVSTMANGTDHPDLSAIDNIAQAYSVTAAKLTVQFIGVEGEERGVLRCATLGSTHFGYNVLTDELAPDDRVPVSALRRGDLVMFPKVQDPTHMDQFTLVSATHDDAGYLGVWNVAIGGMDTGSKDLVLVTMQQTVEVTLDIGSLLSGRAGHANPDVNTAKTAAWGRIPDWLPAVDVPQFVRYMAQIGVKYIGDQDWSSILGTNLPFLGKNSRGDPVRPTITDRNADGVPDYAEAVA